MSIQRPSNLIRGLMYLVGILCVIVIFIRLRTSSRDVEQIAELARGTLKCPHYSPAYPSAGGPGCSPKCDTRNGANSSYTAIFYNRTHTWPKELIDNMHLASDILKKYGTPRKLDTRSTCYLHVSFDYYCCYTPEEAIKIGKFLNSYTWKPHEVWFDQVVCAIHSTGDLVSLVLMVDDSSQKVLLQWALENERLLQIRTGVHKHIPHTRLQGFHMTLAVVNQSEFPVQPAVDEINKRIPPGTWHSTPVILHKPICKKCDQAMATQLEKSTKKAAS